MSPFEGGARRAGRGERGSNRRGAMLRIAERT